jgi:hypothetical protein
MNVGLGKATGYGGGVADVLASLSGFAIASLVFAAALFAALRVFTGRMGFGKKRAAFTGFLCGADAGGLVWLSGQLLRLLFVISAAFPAESGSGARSALYAGLSLIEAAALCARGSGAGKALFSILNNTVIFGAVSAADMLRGFTRDVRGDARIAFVAALTSLFTVLYSLCFTLRDLCDMTRRRTEPERRAGKGGSS